MAASITFIGLDLLLRGVRELPKQETLALRAVAFRTSRRVFASAKARFEAATHGTGRTASGFVVLEKDRKLKAFVVDVKPVPGRPANLPLWIEYGTVKQGARPYMRPAIEAHNASYLKESADVVKSVAERLLG